ncbi:hypothetical protein TUM4637_06270 [Shewanella hafniensis]|uniref:ImmA/IrrE family metallo-endopeptidase n=1 Tax=Shewanella hafniensis TaxID=365590 RepID=UPI001BBDCFBA|nr:ImmA/IrrE family metallo-endopeptidase [Shewanella hafniensis]MCL1135284.1 ImmA/IrrE family metallo-endopeptidase [Shewanella hafniensis]GIU23335.1 hypothetical protein TUM4637_06270 [Shewanella hafniensis]
MSVTGRKIIKSALWDMKSFFVKGRAPSFDVDLGTRNMREHATFSGQGRKARLCFSKEFCSFQVNNVDDYNFVLMIVSHELAHYMHQHNEHTDVDNFDTKSIEAWADYFGAKIMMSLVTFGQENIALQQELGFEFHSGNMINSIGKSLYRLAQTLFNVQDDRYSNRITRVGYCAAGITSFLDSYWGNLQVSRSMDVLTRLYSQGELRDWLTTETENFALDKEIIERATEIHRHIQGYQLAITGGLKTQMVRYIETSFHRSPEMRDLYVKFRVQQARDQGYELPDIA